MSVGDATPRTFVVHDHKSRARLAGIILKLPLDGKREWDVTVKRHVRGRTLKQNSRLHLILSLVAEETGQTIEDVKLGYKALYTAPKIVTLGERNLKVYPSTAKMNVEELNRFMTLVEIHAIENFGIILGD